MSDRRVSNPLDKRITGSDIKGFVRDGDADDVADYIEELRRTLNGAETNVLLWEEDALLRAKNEAFWRDRAERAEARVREVEDGFNFQCGLAIIANRKVKELEEALRELMVFCTSGEAYELAGRVLRGEEKR